MEQVKERNGYTQLEMAGDTTTRLFDYTSINPEFMNLINGNSNIPHSKSEPHALAVPIAAPESRVEAQPSAKRCPEEIAKQLQTTHKKRPLLSSQETIETMKNENLQLKLQLYQQSSMDHSQLQNLVADLFTINQELRSKILKSEESKRKADGPKKHSRDAYCQTNLDSMNIEELIKSNIILKRQREQERLQVQPQQEKREKPPIITQLHYPSVTLPKQTLDNKPLRPDERHILDGLYRLHGHMTTALDKLRERKPDS